MIVAKQRAIKSAFGCSLLSLSFCVVPEVQERRLLADLHRHRLFYCGLAIRIFFILFAIPQIQEEWFIPFVTHRPLAINPWESYLVSGGDPLAFPYGIVMYLAYLPSTSFGWSLDQLLSTSFFTSVCFVLTSLVFDYSLLLVIALLARSYSVRLLLAAYWCSPIVIYVLYCHGQLDILPVSLLVLGLYLLQRQRPWIAGCLLGLACSAKYSMITAIPFIVIYLFRNLRLRPQLRPLIVATSLTLILTISPFLASDSFAEMVLRTPESSRLYAVYLSYGPNLSLFLLPTIYIIALYLIWRLERITLDLFVISVGIGFFSLLLLLPPAPGWFLWVMPFLVFYQLRSQGDYLLPTLPFYAFYLTYNILYSSGAAFPWLGIYWDQPLAQSLGVDTPRINSLLFTAQQSSGLLVCLRMYIFGISRNNYYRRGRYPLVVGIAGDSGAGKDTLVGALIRLLGATSVVHVSGDNYHKWERHHPMWTAKTHLNPHANNLSRLTQDVFTLADGKPIWFRNYDHQTGSFSSLRKVSSSDFVVVSGLHSLYLNRLRKRLDLKVFLYCDEDLRLYWKNQRDPHERGYDLQDVNPSAEQRRIDSEAFINAQSHYADLIFNLSLVNPGISRLSEYPVRPPRVKLLVTMDNGFFHEDLVHSLIALCGMHIDLEQSLHLDSVTLSIEGDITDDDVSQVAGLLIPNLEDLLPSSPCWESGHTGLMQLITLVHISDLLHRSTSAHHA